MALVAWFYFCDDHGWTPFEEAKSLVIENHWQKYEDLLSGRGESSDDGTVPLLKLTVEETTTVYVIDIVNMTQRSEVTGKMRALQRASFFGKGFTWQFGHGDEWSDFTPFQCGVLESLWRRVALAPGTAPTIRMTIKGRLYQFNITTNKQRNVATGAERPIRRQLLSFESAPKTKEDETALVDEKPRRMPRKEVGGDQRLLFPSISTAVFAFDLAIAAEVATTCIDKLFKRYPSSKYPSLRLTLLDYPRGPDTETIRVFKKQWGSRDSRLEFVTGDIALATERPPARCIANAANIKFDGGKSTSGWNRALFVAAGEAELQHDTIKRYPKGGSVGPTFEVPLRPTSPLWGEGVRYVLHAIGPNMNPARPNCLHGDYVVGRAQLELVYTNLLETFAKLTLLDTA